MNAKMEDAGKVFAQIKSEKGFYIGDLCYAMPDELYYEIWGRTYNFDDGMFNDPGSALQFAVGSTAYGDGMYKGSNGFWYPVDAGVIGVVPLELCREDRSPFKEYGSVIEQAGTVTFEAECGKFSIELPDGSKFSIDTSCEDEDEEGSYEEEDDA